MEQQAALPKLAKVVLDQVYGSGKFPGVWTIVKVNQATYGLEQNGVPLKAHKSLVRLATDAEILAFESQPKPVHYIPGMPVRAPRARKMDTRAFYVVLSTRGMNPSDLAKVAKLGGERNGRVWNVPQSFLEPVTLAQLADSLRPHLSAGTT